MNKDNKSFTYILLILISILLIGTGCNPINESNNNEYTQKISEYLYKNGLDGYSMLYRYDDFEREKIYVYISTEKNINKINSEVVSDLIGYINTYVLSHNDFLCELKIEGLERCDIPVNEYVEITNYPYYDITVCSNKLSYMNGNLEMIYKLSDSEIKCIEYLTIDISQNVQSSDPIKQKEFLSYYTELKKLCLVGFSNASVDFNLSQKFIEEIKINLPSDCDIECF
ncbi:MAG: hypothetical protein ACI4RH_09535 [Huintestinicola sp.]